MSRSAVFIIGIFFFMSICDVFRAEDPSDEFSVEFGDEVPDETEEQNPVVTSEVQEEISSVQSTGHFPILKILYCTSCGYKQTFTQFSEFAKEKYPEIRVDGGNFDPEYWKSSLARVISFAKSSILVMIVAGSNPFESLGFGYPRILQYAHNNKLSSGMMLYLVSNMMESALSSTGAFEIYLDDNQIWSKIETGRVPSQVEFLQLLEANLGK